MLVVHRLILPVYILTHTHFWESISLHVLAPYILLAFLHDHLYMRYDI